jgi:D-threo-aldose 1-dehydrogenase
MGCSALGNLYHSVSDSEANAAILTALKGGVRYFDTAPLYGFGLSERRLGAALSAVGTSDVVVSTKVGRLLQPTKDTQTRHGFVDALPFEPVFDYSFEGVMSTHEARLARLKQTLEWRDQAIPPQLWEALRGAGLTAAGAHLPSDGLFE